MHESLTFDEYLELAKALLGDFESISDLWDANDYVNLALRLRPADGMAWIIKSQMLSSLEDDPAALAAAEMALRIMPASAEAHYVRAAVLADMDQFDQALRGVQEAFARVTEHDHWLLEDLFFEKGSLLDALGQEDQALAAFDEGLRRFPDSALLKAGIEPLRRERLRHRLRVIDGGRRRG